MAKNQTHLTQPPVQAQRAARAGGPGRPGQGSGEKAQDFSTSMKKLIRYVKPFLPAILIALGCAVAGVILTLAGPGRLSEMTNLISAGLSGSIDLAAVGRIGLLLVALYGAGMLLSALQGLIMADVTQKVSKGLRTGISEKINRLPLGYFQQVSTGDVLSRMTNDVDTIGQTLNQSLGTLVSAIVMLVCTLVLMLFTNVWMTLAAVLASVLGFGLMILIMGKSQRYFAAQQDLLGQVNGQVEEVYAGHTIVKAYNAEGAMKKEFESVNQALRTSAGRAQFLSGLMMPIMSFIGNLGYVAVCILGAALALRGSISFGVIVAFILYVRYFTQPLSQLAQAAQSLQSTAAASERVFAFLGAEEMPAESHKTAMLTDVRGEVSFEHVRFAYEEGAAPVISDFSAHVQPGQKVAIVGPTGAGKTTLVNLLMRFYEIQGGTIRIDGQDIQSLSRQEVHRQFGMVLQDAWLFEGTLRENIVYGKEGVSEEDVRAACKAVGLHHFIRTLPDGYDTVLSDRVSLSQGQQQQLTIARAMVQNAPMMILDEATSSVDTRTELQIQRAMDLLTKGRTSFIIAHRLSTIKNADLILVLKDGDILEAGTHEALLSQNGFYADLYGSQFAQAS